MSTSPFTSTGSPMARRSLRLVAVGGALVLAGTLWAGPLAAGAAPVDRKQPNAAARQAGVERGNATMGWRDGVERSVGSRAATDSRVTAYAKITRAGRLVPMTGVVGIDVSSYQGVVDWRSFAKVKRSFAYVKATEGTSYRNPYFSGQFGGAKSAGLYAGAYHFANPGGKSGKKQATYFVKYGGRWKNDGKTLPGVLDIEYNPYGGGVCYGLSKKKMVAWITDFVTTYKKLTKRDAVIYTTTDWWTKCTGNTTRFRYTNPLWVARWTPTKGAGTLPGGWPYYTFWQYSATVIDQNRFSNTLARLKVLATRAT
ncbi:MAG TPA: GH25 family lysozyme [Microlunatus sp.]|nr:GH25 family lysozyme [Microlunatus sp.]